MSELLESLSADEFVTRPVWSILSKGTTGTGKTILSCSKYFRPTYVFNLEGRFESAVTFYRRLDGHMKDVEYNNFSLEAGNFYKMDSKMDSIIGSPRYQTVVIASLTSFIHIVLKNLMGGDKGGKKKRGIQTNTIEDYLYEDSAIIFNLIAFLQQLKNMGVNVILEAHISPYEEITLEEGQRVSKTVYQILTKGKKAPAQIPSYFNEVWHFKKTYPENWGASNSAKLQYVVDTLGDSANECKTSFGIQPFDWTGTDPGEMLQRQLNPEIAKQSRVDPNAPKVASW